jgi:hypothetical protein
MISRRETTARAFIEQHDMRVDRNLTSVQFCVSRLPLDINVTLPASYNATDECARQYIKP